MDSPSSEAIDLITRAYNFAAEAHQEHFRYSGEPYFVHLVETAKILAELGKGPITIAAGLLHDTIEDVCVTSKQIEERFGSEVLFLVEGVTKLGQLRYRGVERHIDSLRKLFIAMAEDIRVLIIKLADRLHNMRTLEHVPEAKRYRIALETLEIYAPLAYRLGMRKLTRELEDIAFSHVNPEKTDEIKRLVKQKNKENITNLQKFHKSLLKGLAAEGITNIHSDYRLKSLYSLFKKLERKENDIEKIYDLSALRVIVPSVADCYRILGVIHGAWRPLPGRIKDYIAFPKPNGYRGLHTTVFTGDGAVVEVQIRTKEMHREAEYGIASHLSYKQYALKRGQQSFSWLRMLLPSIVRFDRTPETLQKAENKTADAQAPRWVKELAEYHDQVENEEYMQHLKNDFFELRVFTFTPKGDVVDLPVESSPIDFAYAIHTDLGNHISGACVNGKFVALDTKLQNGDIVKIETKKSSRPNRKWLAFVKTGLAKKCIRSALDAEARSQSA